MKSSMQAITTSFMPIIRGKWPLSISGLLLNKKGIAFFSKNIHISKEHSMLKMFHIKNIF